MPLMSPMKFLPLRASERRARILRAFQGRARLSNPRPRREQRPLHGELGGEGLAVELAEVEGVTCETSSTAATRSGGGGNVSASTRVSSRSGAAQNQEPSGNVTRFGEDEGHREEEDALHLALEALGVLADPREEGQRVRRAPPIDDLDERVAVARAQADQQVLHEPRRVGEDRVARRARGKALPEAAMAGDEPPRPARRGRAPCRPARRAC